MKKQWIALAVFTFSTAQASGMRSEQTYGVETEVAPETQYYVSPSVGMTTLMGNGTMESNSHVGFGIATGVLISQQLLFQVGYLREQQGLSLPRNSGFVSVPGNDPNEVYSYTSNAIDLSAKLFIFGRDSKLRPYLSGGFAYSWNKLNYSPAALNAMGNSEFYSRDFNLKQGTGHGDIGVEYAVSSLFVVNAQFGLQGVISYSGSAVSDDSGMLYDPNKLAIANSLSRVTSYSARLGIGLYF